MDCEFRVRYGFKLLQHGFHREGAAEFDRATEFTDDRVLTLRLLAQMGAALRAGGMGAEAAEAWERAKSYTEDSLVAELLDKNMADLAETGGAGGPRPHAEVESER